MARPNRGVRKSIVNQRTGRVTSSVLLNSRPFIWSAGVVLFGLPALIAAAGAIQHRWHLYAALPWVLLGWVLALPWVVRTVKRRRHQDRGENQGAKP